ncbi:MAG: NAD(P)-dependent alcohol dehydrogenase [Bryobacteraceae bacterium]|jgi:NADPH:quinone reductase-like Zn-dependent oxidoreductase
MRAFAFEDRFSLDTLKLVERPQPKPGPGQALVRVRASSLNYRDLVVASGGYGRHVKIPLIPLSDGAGEVVDVGPHVTRVKPGARVAAIFMQTWLTGAFIEDESRSALGGAIDGMLAEFVVLDQDGLVPIPEHLSYAEAATLPCAAVTAWHALVTEGGIRAGDSVLVLGTGGVSVFALQFARLHGARVIVTSSSDDKLARAMALGASDGINYRQTPEWGRRVLELTGGAGVDHVVEVGGAGTLPQSFRAVRFGGRISLIGVLSEPGAAVDPRPLMMKAARLQGIYVGSREMFEAMNRAIDLHRLRPAIDRIFPFAEAPDAFRYMKTAGHFGKIVISHD